MTEGAEISSAKAAVMTGGRILSIGEAMVELSGTGDGDLWRLGIAGDTLNTAWYLRRLLGPEWRLDYFSRVGMGEFSQKMLDFLQCEGITTDHVSRDPDHEIGLYSISLKDGERSFSYWRDNSAARHLADDPGLVTAALQGCDLAYFSGITLAILPEDRRSTFLDTLARARKSGCNIVFDPNLRPRLWDAAKTMCHWIDTAASISALVLPSFDDESTHFGDADPDETILRYLNAGADQVIVKNGGGAVSFGGIAGNGCIVDLPRKTPVDSTAAGDSFNAAYLAATLRSADPATAIRAGHDLSCRVIGHRGALVREAVSP